MQELQVAVNSKTPLGHFIYSLRLLGSRFARTSSLHSKLSSTAIAAILSIVILIIVTGTIGLTYYAKKNDKCCFVSQSSSNNDTSQTRPLKPIPEEVFFFKDKPSN